jgi:hypothetical protein
MRADSPRIRVWSWVDHRGGQELGLHWRMVREAVRNAVPAQRKKTERPAVKMAAAAALVDAILESDRNARRKQRPTARRIIDRIHAERMRGLSANLPVIFRARFHSVMVDP